MINDPGLAPETRYPENLFPEFPFVEPPDSYPFAGYLGYFSEMRRLGQYPGTKLERGQFAKRNLEGVKDYRHGNGFGIQGTKQREHTAPKQMGKAGQGKVRANTEYRRAQAPLRDTSTTESTSEIGPAGDSDAPPW